VQRFYQCRSLITCILTCPAAKKIKPAAETTWDEGKGIMNHHLSALRVVVIHSKAIRYLFLLILVIGFTILNLQYSTAQADKNYFVKGFTATPPVTVTPSLPSLPRPVYSRSEPLPDLTVDSMSMTLESWGFCIPNLNLGVRVWFSNIGQADAGPFEVALNGQTKSVSGLRSGEGSSKWFAGYPFPITAIVDFTNTVVESDETNNQLTVQALPVPTEPLGDICKQLFLPVIKMN